MLKALVFTFLYCLPFQLIAQVADLSLDHIDLIGIKAIDNNGFVLVNSAGDGIEFIKINEQLEIEWKSELPLTKLRAYKFNKIQIEHSDQRLFVLNQIDTSIHLSIFNIKTGELLKHSVKLGLTTNEATDLLRCNAQDSSLHIFQKESNLINAHVYQSDKELYEKTVTFIESPLSIVNYEVSHIEDRYLYTYTYSQARNHSKMELFLNRTDLISGDSLNRKHELKLEFTSFTYNSTVDDHLLYFYPANDGFYAVGKLDMAFSGDYPTTKLSESFIGFWIAKFNADLELIYISEIPFQFFQGMVTNDMVNKAAVIDIKEDLNSSLFVSITEMRGVLYGKKYVINIDSNGLYTTFIGGQDAYNFFEYDRLGLRNTGKNMHVRLMNDDWSFYSTSYLHMLNYEPQYHSPIIGNILRLKEMEYKADESKIYNFIKSSESVVLMEYIDRKGGLLNFYRFSN